MWTGTQNFTNTATITSGTATLSQGTITTLSVGRMASLNTTFDASSQVVDVATFRPGIICSTAAGTAQQLHVYFKQGAGDGTAGDMGYVVGYAPAITAFFINSYDTDGSQTNADVVRIPDDGVAINGNGAFVDNQFDYVCRICGWHQLEPGSCPKDGRLLVENNDAESIAESVRELKRDPRAQTALHRAGVLVRDKDGWNGINLQGGIFYSLSAIRQQERRITSLQDQIEDLRTERTGISVAWILLGVGIGIVVVLWRGRINRMVRSLPFLVIVCLVIAGSAYALTFEQKVLKGFKRGRYQIGSISALRDSIVTFAPTDSTIRRNTYLDSLATEISRQQSIGYIYQGTNRILLTNVGRAQADSVP